MPRSFGRPNKKLCSNYLFYFDERTTRYTNNFGPFVKFKQASKQASNEININEILMTAHVEPSAIFSLHIRFEI